MPSTLSIRRLSFSLSHSLTLRHLCLYSTYVVCGVPAITTFRLGLSQSITPSIRFGIESGNAPMMMIYMVSLKRFSCAHRTPGRIERAFFDRVWRCLLPAYMLICISRFPALSLFSDFLPLLFSRCFGVVPSLYLVYVSHLPPLLYLWLCLSLLQAV